MYIFKNAIRCISRSKSRNILIGVIVLVISVSACIGLSIRAASESAKESLLDGITVTGSISQNMDSMMENFNGSFPPSGGFDKDAFDSMLNGVSDLTLEEYQKYAGADSVKDFYYTLTAYFNGTESFLAVGSSSESDSGSSGSKGSINGMPQIPGLGGIGGRDQMKGMNSDFTVTGYSKKEAMTKFMNGVSYIESENGYIFDFESADLNCIISTTLATYNSISLGDTITLTNPNNEEETYDLYVVGIYTTTESSSGGNKGLGGTSTNPSNQIYLSYPALNAILAASESVSETITDSTTGIEYESMISGTIDATYVFESVDKFNVFKDQVYTMGLDEAYRVMSPDLDEYETRLLPLNTLSEMAGYFLIVILLIGAVILVVLNVFNVRERKYEIGVLTAMGMKKGKVALQFMCELFVITIVVVTLGIGIGAVSSVPVTNALLEGQVEAQQEQAGRQETNFGGGQFPGFNGDFPTDFNPSQNRPSSRPSGGGNGGFFGDAVDYVTEINSALNFTVVLQMFGIALLLTVVSGMASTLFVMRYEPLKILSNRD